MHENGVFNSEIVIVHNGKTRLARAIMADATQITSTFIGYASCSESDWVVIEPKALLMAAEEKKERLYHHFLLFWSFLFEIFNLYDVHERDLLQSLT
jgi:hypothetical protein